MFPRLLDAVVACGLSHLARIADHDEDQVRRAHERAFDAVTVAWQRFAQAASPEAKHAEQLLAEFAEGSAMDESDESAQSKLDVELAEVAQREMQGAHLPVALSRQVLALHRMRAVRGRATTATVAAK